jgi:hypothetical protein
MLNDRRVAVRQVVNRIGRREVRKIVVAWPPHFEFDVGGVRDTGVATGGYQCR